MPTEPSLSDILIAFNEAFSRQQLDIVMSYFAENAEYRELGGKIARGKPAIRQSFQRAFAGAYGQMIFIPQHTAIDEKRREASFTWLCEHRLINSAGLNLSDKLRFAMLKALYGKCCHWEGIDYFIFDKQLKITSKQSYGKSSTPKFRRGPALG